MPLFPRYGEALLFGLGFLEFEPVSLLKFRSGALMPGVQVVPLMLSPLFNLFCCRLDRFVFFIHS